jgi:type IV secretion system protein VirB10
MRVLTAAAIVLLSGQLLFPQDSDRDFSGDWKLNEPHSDIRGPLDIPAGFLRIERNAYTMTVWAGAGRQRPEANLLYSLAAKTERSEFNGLTFSIATKWEGDALLANIIVGGQSEYSIAERWEKSRDSQRLTITRTVMKNGGEVESTFEYTRPGAVSQDTRPAESLKPPAPPAPGEYVLQPGTRILLRLTNSVNTKHSVAGDRIYLQTAVPVFLNGRLIVPQGSYVTGTITESKEAGRVKGRSGLNFRFDTLTLPNGVTRDFHSRAGAVDAQGSLDRQEGRIEGEGTKGKDAGTVAKTTAGGTGIGAIAGAAAGHVGMGMGIGAAAGAAAGLAGVFSSRGKEVVIPPGTTMEMVLDREVRFTPQELSIRPTR